MKRKKSGGLPRPPEPPASDTVAPEELVPGEEYEDFTAEGADFADAEARGVGISRVRLERASFARSILPGLTLTDASLASCDLAGAHWDRAHLSRIRSDGSRWMGIHLSNGAISDVQAIETSFEMALFGKGRLESSRFERCVFRGAVFEGMTLRGLVFRGCDLRNADFRGSTLDGVDLRGCQIGGLGVTPDRLRGLIIDPSQAAALVESWGAKVLDEEE